MSSLIIGTALAVVACLVLASVLAAAETAFTVISRRDAERLQAAGRTGAQAILSVLDDPAPALNVAVFVRLLFEALAVSLVAVALYTETSQAPWAVYIAAFAMGIILFTGIGISPRIIGQRMAEKTALLTAPILVSITTVLGPIARGLVGLSHLVTPGQSYDEGHQVSDMDLRRVVDRASEGDTIDDGERQMVHSVLALDDQIARELMVPRTDLVAIETGTTVHKALRLFTRSGYSRVPVIAGSRDNVLGMLYFKDAARALIAPGHGVSLEDPIDGIMRDVEFMPDSIPAHKLLDFMRARKTHVVILVDEYGGTAGLVTIEDILEEIVGDISDEHDSVTHAPTECDDGSYIVSARMTLGELGQLFDVDVDDDDVGTVGGLLAKALGKVPIPGAEATAFGWRMAAQEHGGRRRQLLTVRLWRVTDDTDTDHNSGLRGTTQGN